MDDLALLSDLREERFPFEKALALFALSAWVNQPRNSAAVAQAKMRAAAAILLMHGNVFKSADQRAFFIGRSLQSDASLRALLKPAVVGTYADEFRPTEHNSMLAIGLFFLCCLPEQKPSLNKAMYFVSKAGNGMAISAATLKRHWGHFACTLPFIVAADTMDGFADAIYLAPERPTDVKRAIKCSRNAALLQTFIVRSHAIQAFVYARLNKETRIRLKGSFLRFPINMPAPDFLPDEFYEPMTQPELTILSSYQARDPYK